MSVEIATDALERHEHLQHAPEDHHGRRTALLIGVMAAVLALAEMAERSAQNAYLSHHIAVSDDYAFYQARQTRALILNETATVLHALAPATAEIDKQVADTRAEALRLTEDSERGNGLKQLQARTAAEAAKRDVALHRYEWLEIVTSALQIAIVLASVSVVTQWRPVAYLGAAIGAGAAALALLVVNGMV
jgi:Flp pilus assembly CpaE family ATPase